MSSSNLTLASEYQWEVGRLRTGVKNRWSDATYRTDILRYLIVLIVEEVDEVTSEDFEVRSSVYTDQTLKISITSQQPIMKYIKFVEGLFRDKVHNWLCGYSYAGSFDWVAHDTHFRGAYEVVFLTKSNELAFRADSFSRDARSLLNRSVPGEGLDIGHLAHALAIGLGLRQPDTTNLHHLLWSDPSLSSAEREALQSTGATINLVRTRLADGSIAAKLPHESLASFLQLLQEYTNYGFGRASDNVVVEFLAKVFPHFEGLLQAAYFFKTIDAGLRRLKSERGHKAFGDFLLGTLSFGVSGLITTAVKVGLVTGLAGYAAPVCLVASVVFGAYKYTVSFRAGWSWRKLRNLIARLENALIAVGRIANTCGTVLAVAGKVIDEQKSRDELQSIALATLEELGRLGTTLEELGQTLRGISTPAISKAQ